MKRIHAWGILGGSALLVAASVSTLLWNSHHNGYSMVCGTRLDITYDSLRRDSDKLTGEMSLQLKKDYTGTLNVAGDVYQDDKHLFHMFRSVKFNYELADKKKGLVNLKFTGVEFYPPDSEKNQYTSWPINKKDTGKEMELIVNMIEPGLMLVSNFYSPVMNCGEILDN